MRSTEPTSLPLAIPGCACWDGKVYKFDWDSITVFSPWPEVRAWTKTRRRGWRRVRPRITLTHLRAARDELRREPVVIEPRPDPWQPLLPLQVCRTESAARQADAIDRLLQPIPRRVADIVDRFCCRHWELLLAAARVPCFAERLKCNPGLGFSVASCFAFDQSLGAQRVRAIRRLSRQRQRDAASALGFPGGRSTVRILQRIHPAALTVPRLLELRRALHDSAAATLLRQVPRHNASTLAILGHEVLRKYATPGLLAEIAEREEDAGRPAFADIFQDTLALA